VLQAAEHAISAESSMRGATAESIAEAAAGLRPANPQTLPGHQDTWANDENDDRAPLLFVSGSEDHIMPPAVPESNRKHYKSNAITERREYEGYAHLLPAQKGWEQIANDDLEWALAHAR
jgi:pimeloyl-ACP methyl ester carboxylesterase